ncbi:MAG: FimB/Mfa2 family fimbrial subunit [Prevotella sp.]|nr:FimB/Mfa2 family fimbrial subunit [Prevotella sp.]
MNNKHAILTGLFLSFVMGLGLTSCEKAVFDEEEEQEQSGLGTTAKNEKGNVTISVSSFRQVPFDGPGDTRAATDVTSYFKRLNFVIYKDGEKKKALNQMSDNQNFGTVTLSLAEGTYKLLVVASSGLDNPTLSNPEKIQFTNKIGYTDTFSYYGDLEVTSEAASHEITLTRNVSCLKFIINDEFPENVKYMKFYYTGGSGVLNAVTGYGGLVNSQQAKKVDVTGRTTPLTFNLYTFLQSDEALLQVRVTALESDEKTIVAEREFEDVPMKYQMITEYAGSFFNHDHSISFKAETDWGEPYHHYDY